MKKNKTSYAKILLFIFLIITISASSLQYICQHQEVFFAHTYHARFESLKFSYDHSQYVQKKNPGIITDEQFEAYAAGAFLKGLNPILIVHDHPPLGRYILSVSIILFDNENTIMLLLLALSYIGIFLISQHIVKNIFVSLIPVALLMNEPLFFNKLVYTPLPEPVLLPFIVFAIYFFIRGITEKKYLHWFILSSLSLGCIISIRFFVLGVTMLFVMFFYLFFFEKTKEKFLRFAITTPLVLVVLELAYTRTVMLSHNPLQVLSIQKYILAYHKSAFVVPFTFWDLLLFNRWHSWWGNRAILTDPQWLILWPISVIISLVYGLTGLLKKIKLSSAEIFLFLWIIGYSLMLSVGYSSTRYFLPLLPFFYILMVSGINKLFIIHRKAKLK